MRAIRMVATLAVSAGAVSFPLSAAGAAPSAPAASAANFPIATLRDTLADPGALAIDGFGYAVARSGTGVGATTIVGVYGTNDLAGAAYLYVRGVSGLADHPDGHPHPPRRHPQ